MKEADTYKGHIDGMKLMDGAITANVDLNGTITAAGKADFTINVIWVNDGTEIPILVKFNGQKTSSAVETITTDVNAPAEYYNLNGIRVSESSLAPGLYIRRQGGKSTKIIVK